MDSEKGDEGASLAGSIVLIACYGLLPEDLSFLACNFAFGC